jgi:nicotinamidase-related amidase
MKKLPTLILIDIQKGFDDPCWGKRNNPNAEDTAATILDFWRQRDAQVIHVQHLSTDPRSPLHPSSSGCSFKPEVLPRSNEVIVQKRTNSAFIGTVLENILTSSGAKELAIVGLTTPHCVSTTTRMAANLGFGAYIFEDATAAFGLLDHNGKEYSAQAVHDLSLATLHGEFATILKLTSIHQFC